MDKQDTNDRIALLLSVDATGIPEVRLLPHADRDRATLAAHELADFLAGNSRFCAKPVYNALNSRGETLTAQELESEVPR